MSLDQTAQLLARVESSSSTSSSESASTFEAAATRKRKAEEVRSHADAVVKKVKPDSRGPKKRIGHKSHYDEIVYLEVGPTENSKRVGVHKGVLCFYSGHFERACMGVVEVAAGGIMKMAADPEVVEIFVHWVYSQKLFDANVEDNNGVPLFRNTVIDTLLKQMDEGHDLPLELLDTVYETSRPASPLRKVFVNYYIQSPSAYRWIERLGLDILPKGFLVDYGVACHQLLTGDIRRDAKAQIRQSPCFYHDHELDEKCE